MKETFHFEQEERSLENHFEVEVSHDTDCSKSYFVCVHCNIKIK